MKHNNDLLKNGWREVHSQLFTHPQHGNLYHEDGHWYWARVGAKAVKVGRTLAAAIPVIMEKTAQGVLV